MRTASRTITAPKSRLPKVPSPVLIAVRLPYWSTCALLKSAAKTTKYRIDATTA